METGSNGGRRTRSIAAAALTSKAGRATRCWSSPRVTTETSPDRSTIGKSPKSNSASSFALPLFTNLATHIACRDLKRFNLYSDLSIIVPVHEAAQPQASTAGPPGARAGETKKGLFQEKYNAPPPNPCSRVRTKQARGALFTPCYMTIKFYRTGPILPDSVT